MDLEPVWNGQMERAGTAAGLCSFGQQEARSSLHYSIASWETLEHGEVERHVKPRTVPNSKEGEILALLKRGTLRMADIIRMVGVSNSVVIRVARRHGIRMIGATK
jgi:hypothetical protein